MLYSMLQVFFVCIEDGSVVLACSSYSGSKMVLFCAVLSRRGLHNQTHSAPYHPCTTYWSSVVCRFHLQVLIAPFEPFLRGPSLMLAHVHFLLWRFCSMLHMCTFCCMKHWRNVSFHYVTFHLYIVDMTTKLNWLDLTSTEMLWTHLFFDHQSEQVQVTEPQIIFQFFTRFPHKHSAYTQRWLKKTKKTTTFKLWASRHTCISFASVRDLSLTT